MLKRPYCSLTAPLCKGNSESNFAFLERKLFIFCFANKSFSFHEILFVVIITTLWYLSQRPEYIWKFANNKDFLPDGRRLSGKIAPSSNDVRNFSISYQNVIVCQSFFQTWFSLRKKWRTKWERSLIYLQRFFWQFSVCRGYCNVQVENMVSKSGLHHEDWNVSQN